MLPRSASDEVGQARRYSNHLDRWAIYSLSIAVLIFTCFVAGNVFPVLDATHALPDVPTGLVQRISIISGWTWIAMVPLQLIRGRSAFERRAELDRAEITLERQ